MQNYDSKSHGKKRQKEDSAVGTFYYRKKYFSTPTICLKLHRAHGNRSDPRFAVTFSFWASVKNIGQENHLLSHSIYKVMNIHTPRPGMNCDQSHHFPQFMEQFCSLIKMKL